MLAMEGWREGLWWIEWDYGPCGVMPSGKAEEEGSEASALDGGGDGKESIQGRER